MPNRAVYKIFYGEVHRARILSLGVNPGGDPANMNPNGRTMKDGFVASASARYHENGRHDVLDCEWRENPGLRALLTPLVGGDPELIRRDVVKTNVAFRRSAKKTDLDIEAAIDEANPFLTEIILRVRPKLVLLTGVPLRPFLVRHATDFQEVVAPKRDAAVKQVVFAAARARFGGRVQQSLVVQVAHASQFSWTYRRYRVTEKILKLLHEMPNGSR